MFKKVIGLVLTVVFMTGLTACNTVKGVGQDVERGGEKMQNAADKSKN